MDLKEVIAQFDIKGDFRGYKTLTSGNINSTYELMLFDNGSICTYVLQKINKFVFKKPYEVMENILKITEFMRNNTNSDTDRMVLRYFRTKDNSPCFIDEKGEYWRCYRYIDDSVTYDKCEDLGVIREAGKAFGHFQAMLLGFDASVLYETIPDFHNTRKRLTTLFHTVVNDEFARVKGVKDCVEYIIDNREQAEVLCAMQKNGEIPLKVTHNDTKCNNVLFDIDSGNSLAVIDLDTVMPGLVAHDFGDAVRSIASSTAEDEKDLSKVEFNLEKFEAFTQGFMGELKGMLSENEIKSLSYGPYVLTVELASRFLDDYINGDKYFKINYPLHNLDRTKCQIQLAKDILNKQEKITEIINKYR